MELLKIPLSMSLHNMPTLQLLLQQAFSQLSCLPDPTTADPAWRASNLKMSILDATKRERDWLMSKGS